MEKTTDSFQTVSRSALRFSAGTFLSRVTGLVREQATAYIFGTSALIAAFMIAYRFALTLRRLLGENALLAGFVPHFEEIHAKSPKNAALFFRDVQYSLIALLLLVLTLVEGTLFIIIQSMDLSVATKEIIVLTMLIAPSLFFLSLYALSSALLQCTKQFFLPALAPALFNLTWIGIVSFVYFRGGENTVIGLTFCTLAAFFVQWALLLPSTLRFMKSFLSFGEICRIQLFSGEFRALFKSITVTMIGLGAIQINGLLDTIFARIASLEGPAFMYYATRLYQLPVSLIGISLSSAILPSLSRAWEAKEHDHFKRLLSTSLRRAASLTLPMTFALLCLSDSAISFLFYRGNFSAESVFNTTQCLWALALGLVPATFSLLLAQPFYARKNYRIPTLASIYTVAINAVLNVLFTLYFEWGAYSIGIATSIASLFNAFYLWKHLDDASEISTPLFKDALASLLAAGTTWGIAYLYFSSSVMIPTWGMPQIPSQVMDQLIQLSLLTGVFFASLVLFAKLFKASEILHLLRLQK
ncbi:MAG: murein biosynthesis integral membrane protein MurJ [Verrucomicrobia bacterium]|nr:murein biosynthesis integral membrane protein MurJ [Verrucomicrobiota bacterium]